MKNTSLDASKALLTEINNPQPQLTKIKQYLDDGADINYQSEEDGYTALMLAVDNDDEPTVTYLLEQGADPLVQNQHKEIASNLALTYSPIYQTLKNYELLFATVDNDITAVKAALDAGANVNFQGQAGYTALLIAVEQSQLELVELLMVKGADLTLERDDKMSALELASDDLIYRTIFAKEPLDDETKQMIKDMNDHTRWEKGRLKSLADRKGQPFALSQLKMYPTDEHFKPAPSDAQLAELEQHFGHPLPFYLKEILIHYNGCHPTLDYFDENLNISIDYFYFVDEHRDADGSIWNIINNYADDLGPETLPFAEDDFGGIFFLKWVKGKAQVWLFQYGDDAYNDYDEESEDEDETPTSYTFIKNSFEELLEAMYAISN